VSYEPKRAPDQPAANDPQYQDAMMRYTVIDHGTVSVGVDKDARIAELEADNRALLAKVTDLKERIPGAWRLCGACAHHEYEHELCTLLDVFSALDFACNRWTARSE